ncbi:hypothetical protein LOK49_LG07G02805 [Camellia lanceoleosa]|uniref:Uncharacterized protein n=1 Tax=Camellia lanceoleosa TaxID=1840588 RepID=A0ACC0GYU8_9ERIC|nr:hypothetical protein LOK49_LG07G02805 [Camellia lanceoleosa]
MGFVKRERERVVSCGVVGYRDRINSFEGGGEESVRGLRKFVRRGFGCAFAEESGPCRINIHGEVREPRLHLPSLRLERVLKVFIGCYKPPTSVKNSKRLGDRSSKWEPAGNQDFSTSSGSVNPKLPEIRDPLDLDLETTNSGSIFLKLQEYGDPLDPDLETINLCELNSRTDLVKTVSSVQYRVCVEVDATKEIPNSFKINLGYCEPYEIKVEVSWRPWCQRHDGSMAIGEASNSLPSRAEEKGKDVVKDSTFASTSIMFDVLDQLTSMEGPRGDNTEMILMPCPSSSTNLDVLASCAPIVKNSRGQRKSKGEDKLFSSNKANPSGLVEIEILGTNEEEIEGNLPRELVETLVKKEDEGLVLGECKL